MLSADASAVWQSLLVKRYAKHLHLCFTPGDPLEPFDAAKVLVVFQQCDLMTQGKLGHESIHHRYGVASTYTDLY